MDFQPMPEELARTLVGEAHKASPNEMCGFIIEGWSYIPIANCHPEPERHFNMEERAMLDVLTHNAHKVLGIYHSHPRGARAPSQNDVELMINYSVHNFRFWILTPNNVFEWRIHRDQPCPVRRDGTTPGPDGMAYAILATPTPI